jgi:hypothetical protein
MSKSAASRDAVARFLNICLVDVRRRSQRGNDRTEKKQ